MTDTTPETIEVESIRRLNVRPGEVLVVTLPGDTSRDQFDAIRAAMAERLPDGIDFLVVNDRVQLGVVSKPRKLPNNPAAYSEAQWSELTAWLARHGHEVDRVQSITLSDDQVTITAYRRNHAGERYIVGDEIATSHQHIPLSECPSWLPDLASAP